MLERVSARVVCYCIIVFRATHASAWIPSFPLTVARTCATSSGRIDSRIRSRSDASPRPTQSMRHSIALSLSPRDLGREDESNHEEEEAAAAAAKAARESLERMWSSSPSEDSSPAEDSSSSRPGDEREQLQQGVALPTGTAAGLPELSGEGEDGGGAEVGILEAFAAFRVCLVGCLHVTLSRMRRQMLRRLRKLLSRCSQIHAPTPRR